MNRKRILVGLTVAVAVAPFVSLAVLSFMSRAPNNLGIRDGRLAACPASPNCVSSTADNDRQRIAPLSFEGTAADAIAQLAEVMASFPRARVVEQTETYLRAEFTSAVFRFVDDVEFLAHETDGRIDVRSASRVGYSDFGVNRRRVESIRVRFAQ